MSEFSQSNTTRHIIGESDVVEKMLGLIHRVAATKTNVLIIGESGTGKELIARMIHEEGPFKSKPFIPVNCGAIPETLIESELFGYKKGSFTGADGEKMGLFEAANGGTLFLDEIGEIPLHMQVKLLRAIQERRIRKVGGTDDIEADARIIAATNKDLEIEIGKGTFREDLYYRLNVILIKAPPLRERLEDIILLANHFLKIFCEKSNKSVNGFSEEAISAIRSYGWPGNVRELENAIERAATLESELVVGLDSFPKSVINAYSPSGQAEATKISSSSTTQMTFQSLGTSSNGIQLPAADFSKGPLNLDAILGDVEKTYLMAALDAAGGVKKKAAELLGITFRSIRYRLKKLGVELENGS